MSCSPWPSFLYHWPPYSFLPVCPPVYLSFPFPCPSLPYHRPSYSFLHVCLPVYLSSPRSSFLPFKESTSSVVPVFPSILSTILSHLRLVSFILACLSDFSRLFSFHYDLRPYSLSPACPSAFLPFSPAVSSLSFTSLFLLLNLYTLALVSLFNPFHYSILTSTQTYSSSLSVSYSFHPSSFFVRLLSSSQIEATLWVRPSSCPPCLASVLFLSLLSTQPSPSLVPVQSLRRLSPCLSTPLFLPISPAFLFRHSFSSLSFFFLTLSHSGSPQTVPLPFFYSFSRLSCIVSQLVPFSLFLPFPLPSSSFFIFCSP